MITDEDFAAVFTTLNEEEAEERSDWRQLFDLVGRAKSLLSDQQHLSALAELYAAEDLEIDLTGDCKATAPITNELIRLLGLEEEETFGAWWAAKDAKKS